MTTPVATPDPTLVPPTRTPTGERAAAALDALQAALAGEHAVIYAYGVLGPRTADDRRDQVRRTLLAHVASRDDLRARVVGRGAVPVAAEPAYALPVQPRDASSALELAAFVEERLAAVYADLVAAADTDAVRELAVTGVIDAARRQRLWGGDVAALPGMPDEPPT